MMRRVLAPFWRMLPGAVLLALVVGGVSSRAAASEVSGSDSDSVVTAQRLYEGLELGNRILSGEVPPDSADIYEKTVEMAVTSYYFQGCLGAYYLYYQASRGRAPFSANWPYANFERIFFDHYLANPGGRNLPGGAVVIGALTDYLTDHPESRLAGKESLKGSGLDDGGADFLADLELAYRWMEGGPAGAAGSPEDFQASIRALSFILGCLETYVFSEWIAGESEENLDKLSLQWLMREVLAYGAEHPEAAEGLAPVELVYRVMAAE